VRSSGYDQRSGFSSNKSSAVTVGSCNSSILNGQVAEAIDVPNSTNTVPEAINPGSVITGYYTDLNFEPHGWVRTASGAFTSFHPPGTSETFPLAINPAGTIGGNYGDATGVNHGFLRSRDGTIITFDVPGAGTSLNQGTFATATALNPAGTLAGGLG
jgi:hypothetical protein